MPYGTRCTRGPKKGEKEKKNLDKNRTCHMCHTGLLNLPHVILVLCTKPEVPWCKSQRQAGGHKCDVALVKPEVAQHSHSLKDDDDILARLIEHQ
jgi:hypothetical protein